MDTTSESIENFREGERVSVRVVRMTASGAIVQLEGGQGGIIRNREMYWARSLGGPDQVVEVGDEFQAIVLEVDHDRKWIELSRKRALDDPWEKVRQAEYCVGMIVSGEIVNVVHYGAFVELEPGIIGLLHKEAVPGRRDGEIQELLWIGDQVEVVITSIDLPKQRIGLSITERLSKRHIGKRLKPGHVKRAKASEHDARTQTKSVMLPNLLGQALGQRIRRILVVDDDTEFATGFAEWLKRRGYQVTAVETGAQAISDDLAYDLVFLDIDLPDTDGIDVADNIMSRRPDVEIVLITGLTWFEYDTEMLARLKVAAVLLKPLDYSEVLKVLSLVEEGMLKRKLSQSPVLRGRDAEFFELISAPLHARQSLREGLEKALDSLREETEAKATLIFEVDPFTLNVSILAGSNFDTTNVYQGTLQSLRFSPVRDVALDEEEILERSATYSSRFAALLQLLYFESCVAVPIPVAGHDCRYALFLFDPSPDQFTPAYLVQVLSVSRLIAVAIQEEKVRSLIRESQRSILIGQLAVSLMHELRNKINRIEQQARNLELDYQELSEAPRAMPLNVWSSKSESRVKRILNANSELRGLILEYLGLMGEEELEEVDVNELLLKTVRQIGPVAQENRVEVVSRLDSRLQQITAIPLRLEQVFLNVALNAIQQMGGQEPPGGLLQITSLYDTRDKDYPLKIRFADEGPGVHRRHWDWVFEMGTSTREGGTGLGLFVSKGVVESMGGRISLEKSYMFVGSTFLIELPIVSAEEAANG
jgi:signal transduction histidine kinase/predicted RNA-binding protein with RPS1 domain/ActR/RegA family two-component response regulator